MKDLLFYFLLILFFGVFAPSCAKYEIEAIDLRDDKIDLSIEEAKEDFDLSVNYSKSRTNESEQDANALNLGWLYPYWELSQSSEDSRIISLDTPVESQHNYSVAYHKSDSLYTAYPLYHGALVVKGKEDLATTSYIIFYIPDSTHVAKFHTDNYNPPYLNSNVKDKFSGSAVYTTTSGFPFAFNTFKEGRCTDALFLADTTLSLDYRCDKLAEFLDNLPPIIKREDIATRSNEGEDTTETKVTDENYDGYCLIGDVLVETKSVMSKVAWDAMIKLQYQNLLKSGNYNGQEPEDPTTQPLKPNENQDAGSSSESGIGPKFKDPKIKKRIDSLQNDCIGAKLVDSLEKHNITFVADYNVNNAANTHIDSIDSNGALTGTIVINPNTLDIVFIEELTHIVQIANNPNFASQKLNIEIEAKLVWIHYCVINNIDIRRYHQALGSTVDNRLSAVSDIILLYRLANIMRNNSSEELLLQLGTLFQIVEGNLRNIPTYSDPDKYPYDETNSSLDTFYKITEDC